MNGPHPPTPGRRPGARFGSARGVAPVAPLPPPRPSPTRIDCLPHNPGCVKVDVSQLRKSGCLLTQGRLPPRRNAQGAELTRRLGTPASAGTAARSAARVRTCKRSRGTGWRRTGFPPYLCVASPTLDVGNRSDTIWIMYRIQIQSIASPYDDPQVAPLAASALSRAEAMGLCSSAVVHLDSGTMDALEARLAEVGIARFVQRPAGADPAETAGWLRALHEASLARPCHTPSGRRSRDSWALICCAACWASPTPARGGICRGRERRRTRLPRGFTSLPWWPGTLRGPTTRSGSGDGSTGSAPRSAERARRRC